VYVGRRHEILVVFTSCAASKDDSVPISTGARVVEPTYYLDEYLIPSLLSTRERTFSDPRASVGTKTSYALDLYGRKGRAYKKLLESNYPRLKSMLLSGDSVEWFFLSGGYGIVHALEKASKYQATFSQGIAYQNDIPYTGKIWKPLLTQVCDSILLKFHPDFVYVFGSRDYTEFIKQTSYWKTKDNVRMFESTGSAGPSWLSPILDELVDSILLSNIDAFNSKYGKFTKH
jgi:hypothetical protein